MSFSVLPRSRLSLRIAVVQFCPKFGDVETNLATAREYCSRLRPHSIDLLCFPEMAFTGYVFDSAESILPHLETPYTGPTSRFCKEIANQLHCYVTAGYPERLSSDELLADDASRPNSESPNRRTQDGCDILPGEVEKLEDLSDTSSMAPAATALTVPCSNPVGANSAVIYGPSGEWVGGYRKTNLFVTDMTWAKPGTGFSSFNLQLLSAAPETPRSIKMTLGICMDLNPQPPAEWNGVDGPYELAEYCIKSDSKLLVLLDNWLDPSLQNPEVEIGEEHGPDGTNEDHGDDETPEWNTLNYWCARLKPLWVKLGHRRSGSNESIYSDDSNDSTMTDNGEYVGELPEEETSRRETIVVACNRTGKENGTTFAGSSAIFRMNVGAGRPKLLDMMGKREQGIRVWNLMI